MNQVDSSKIELYETVRNDGGGLPPAHQKKALSDGCSTQSRVSLRFRQPKCLSCRTRAAEDRAAYRREIRLRPGAARRSLQGDRQHVTRRVPERDQEQRSE